MKNGNDMVSKMLKAALLAVALLQAAQPAAAANKKTVKVAAKATEKAEKAPEKAAADKAEGSEPRAVEGTMQAIRRQVEEKLQDMEVRKISKTRYGGLYEIVADDKILYTDASVSFFFVGNLFDAKTMRNITEDRMQDLLRVRFDLLPLDLAIKTVKGSGARKLAVFSDPDCPYCKRLEQELLQVKDITIYTFLYPIESLHPGATQKSKSVWCSADRAKAWEELMQKGTQPAAKGDCENPVARLNELGGQLRVTGTPTLVFADGRLVAGAVPADQLELMLKAAEGQK